MYTKDTKKQCLQRVIRSGMVLSVDRIEESDGYKLMICYDVYLIHNRKRVYQSLESNLQRVWYIYDTIFKAIHQVL